VASGGAPERAPLAMLGDQQLRCMGELAWLGPDPGLGLGFGFGSQGERGDSVLRLVRV